MILEIADTPNFDEVPVQSRKCPHPNLLPEGEEDKEALIESLRLHGRM